MDDFTSMIHTDSKKVQVLVIDPPWPKKKGGLRKSRIHQTRDLDYSTLGVDEIFSLLDSDVLPLVDEQNTVFLWGVDQFLAEGEDAMERRGYRRHARFIWDKGNGIAPAFTVRYSHEYLTWFYKPKMLPICQDYRGKFTTVIREKSREHSRKPNAVYSMIESLYPNAQKMDVFSREKRPGWGQFGNQPGYFETEDHS